MATRELRWEARVHDRAERTWKQFDAFLKDADPDDGISSPFLPFGSVDLSVHAVAIREPALAIRPPRRPRPIGVAELFRDCFEAADAHRDPRHLVEPPAHLDDPRRGRARVRDGPRGAGGRALPTRPRNARSRRADQGLPRTRTPAGDRLADANIGRYKRLLADFRDDPAFTALPEDHRAFVLDRLQEIDSYQAYRGKLAVAIAPGDTRTLEDLQRIEQALDRGELSLPTMAWEGTPAAELREKWLADAKASAPRKRSSSNATWTSFAARLRFNWPPRSRGTGAATPQRSSRRREGRRRSR